MRRNIDAWWPAIEDGAEGIVFTASACGAMAKDYAEHLRHDPDYAAKAARVSTLARDIAEVLEKADVEALPAASTRRVAFHCPCTLQHGQGLAGRVESILRRGGFPLSPVQDPHLCCGSAGTYSILQPVLSGQLLDNKLTALQAGDPELIATANIGCQLHLASAAAVPVLHWIELFDPS
jgi:glycolate oxidase iron-sulfur subunit